MSIRLVSSAKNLRDQFKNAGTSSNVALGSSVASIHTNSSISRSQTLGPPANVALSRRGTLLRTTSTGALRPSKSQKKGGLMSKVFADEVSNSHDSLPDLSMEMTHLIVKRCVKEIRERGLTTKGILRQVQMGQSQKVIIDTIRIILDDDASTELSPLHQIDIHLVVDAMKWAIRYAEEILVSFEDYQTLYINQDRDFILFVHALPTTNRAILLELFSLCADVTLLAHLNNMTLVSVAKAISLSIMAGPEREFTTFDASLQQRNLWGAACEDLLRAFLRIKTTYDLAKLDQEDEVDENRYICNETRVLKSARQQPNESGRVPANTHFLDISAPSSVCSTGWPTPSGTMSCTPHSNGTGYFDMVAPSPPPSLAHAGGTYGASLSRSQSFAKSRTPAISTMSCNMDDSTEYEELMKDRAHLQRRQDRNNLLRPTEHIRRRSSVTDMDSLYMLPAEVTTSADGYDSDPEVSHPIEDEDSQDSLIPDFADGLGWDFSRKIDLDSNEIPSLDSFKVQPDHDGKFGVNRSNSASSNTSGLGPNGPSHTESPRSIRDLSKQQLTEMRLRQLQDQQQSGALSPPRVLSQQDMCEEPQTMNSSPHGSLQRMGSMSRARVGQAMHNSPAKSSSYKPQRAVRNSALRRSISINSGRLHMKPNELQADLLAQELALQTEKDLVAQDIRQRLRGIRESDSLEPDKASSAFSLQQSPLDLEQPVARPRRLSPNLMSDRPTSMLELNMADMSSLPADPSLIGVISHEPTSITPIKESEGVGAAHSTSPKAELKSKSQESLPDRSTSPPAGHSSSSPRDMPKRSMTGGSSKSDHSSKMPLQQTVTYSGASASSSQPSPIESKAKTPGFIRALSSKLRSKPSDDQLKAVKINNQVVGTPAVPPSVSIEPPRLELTFMGDSLRSAELGPDAGPEKGSQLPMTAVPAWMTHPDSGANAPERWRRESLPILNSSNNGGTVSENQDLRPKGFMGLRRASAAVFGSGNNSLREQQPKSKNGSPPMTRPLLTKNDDDSSYRAPLPSSKHQEVEQQETSLPTDLSVPTQGSSPSSGTGSSILKKATVVENEIHFSTATVLKDGKLYYQVLWDQFSDLGIQSDLFEPDQYLSGIHHPLGLSQADPWKQQTEAAATAILMRKQCISNSQFMASIAAADSCSHSLDLPGQQLGQATRNRTANAAIEITNQDQEPSPAQMAAAMNVARESFMVLTSDPTTLATFMEMSATRPGQPVIMNSGTFTKGSVVPRMNSPSQPRMNTSKKIPNQQSKQKQQQLYPSLNRNPNNRLKPTRSVPMASMNGDEPDNAQRNIYDKSLPISSTTVKTASLTDFQTTKQPGLVAIGGGGAGFSASLSPAPQRLHKRSDSTSSSIVAAGGVTKGKKDKGFFGKRLTKGAKSSNSGRKRRLLPLGVRRQDVMTKTVESMDEVFPWTCTEHMAGDESEWVMLEPANNGAVGWVVVDMLEDDVFGGDAQ